MLQEEFVNLRHGFEAVQPFDTETKFHGNRLDQLVGIQNWIQNQRGGEVFAQSLQKRPAKSGLASPYFPGNLDKPFSLSNTVKQVIKGFTMLRAVKKEARVRG